MTHPLFPVIELIDRLAIAEVKFQRSNGANYDELSWYQQQASAYDFASIQEQFIKLKDIHNIIWDLEGLLKSGKENELSLEEIGRRAIIIRNHNNKRIAIKNFIAEQLKCTVREIKKDHLSE
jgi:hypothetical protein